MSDNTNTKEKKDKNNFSVENRKSGFDYEILERYEAGISLVGSEIKSIRNGHVGIAEAYAYVDNGEVFVKGMRIDPYKDAPDGGHDPIRIRKLLLKKQEISRIENKLIKGTTLILTRLYLNERGICKVQVGLGKGKKNHDKREAIKDREVSRELDRVKKNR